jgi:hypothetical protein
MIMENNPHSIIKDPPPKVVITTDAAPEAWGATLKIVKNNKFFNPEREVKKLTLTEILQSTITEWQSFLPNKYQRRKTKASKEYQIVKNMVFDRPKRDGSESCPHSRKIKYDDG